MISYGIVIFFLLGFRVTALQDEMQSFSSVDATELDQESMSTLSENYDMTADVELAQEIADEFIDKKHPDYTWKYGEKAVGVLRCFGPRLCFYLSNQPDEPFRYCVKMHNGRCTYQAIPTPVVHVSKCTPYNRLGRLYRTTCGACNRYGGCMVTKYSCNGFKNVNGRKVCNFKKCKKMCKGVYYAKSCFTSCY